MFVSRSSAPSRPPGLAGQTGKFRTMQGAVLALLLAVFSLPLWGQIDRGSIRGIVKDQSGAVVPDADVQVIRIDTGSAIALKTNGSGLYSAPNLPAANYRITVE